MARRQKYAVWNSEAVKLVIDYANTRRDNNLRMNWQECAELVNKTPRQCFDLYRNRVIKKEKHSFEYDSSSGNDQSSEVEMLDFKPFQFAQEEFQFLVFDDFE